MKVQKFFQRCFLTCLVFGLSHSMFAQDVEKTEPVIVTATKVETPARQVTQSYSVIDSNEISARKEEKVLEMMRDVPGVAVVQNGTWGANSSIFIRGANSSQSLVLIDGVRVNSPLVGNFDFGGLPTDNIDRIEVVRGPQSILYGSEAMGGVVNIITKRGEDKPHFVLESEGGNKNTGRVQLSETGKIKKADYAYSASYLTTQGDYKNDAYENFNWSGNVGVDLNEKLRLDLITRVLSAEKGLQDFGLTMPDPNRSLKTESELVALKLDGWVGDFWNQKLTLSWVHENLKDKDPLNPDEIGNPFLTRICDSLWMAQWQNDFYWGDFQTITLGFEYQGTQGKNTTTGNLMGPDYSFKEDLNYGAVYLQDQINLWDRLFLTPGVRVQEHNVFGTELTPNISGAFWLFKQTKLKASWGEGFRTPGVNELLYPNYGNPDLKAEKSKGWEAGFEQFVFEGRAGVEAVYFRNDFDDLIDTEIISEDPFIGRANNISKAKTDGVELSGFVKPLSFLTLKAGWTYLDAENEMTKTRLMRRARNTSYLEVLIDWDRLTFSAVVTMVGKRPDFDRELKSYLKMDAAIAYRINENITPYIKCSNLLDKDYEEAAGFPAPGIQVLGGFKVEF